ncbi:MAG: hypothetical protein A2087_07195 [Spirochaetes bacterium GWD1_61_31]|nr:MAG: hypothetical protein A2Y37_08280 [Spirochaetes bacterium GWB1_60_80]OHD34201.1 MAG: hypothetical protein A2004_12465 [Spirochaetes bacterium GWC1_61_12]OHD40129.1 MAG: hypothetical protein A2087_07195 [Spirochaetes bacterium GWD1_61_31]OHD45823.1 MAG: hypothetical protein A2Y35_03915 [Spirochaetes bacterium GWE1_60_18]OHD58366.1 MAG: hypothetical protein A2Y32_06305 [Spirochaetes bacterium GWF1_60_12]HAW86523.1 hypothetical protein [Spirochaetaceae bacterium]
MADTGRVLESKITRVTVYGDRAMVGRQAQLELPAGEAVLVFNGLPDVLDADSVQVSGSGAILRDIKVTTQQTAELPVEELRQLETQKLAIEDHLAELADRRAQASAEKDFVTRITQKLTGAEGGKPGVQEFNPEAWMTMVEYYRRKLEELDGQLRGLNREERPLKLELQAVIRRLQVRAGGAVRRQKTVTLVVEAKQAGQVDLEIRYLVSRAAWRAQYDLRIDPEPRRLALHYNALVTQSTGEDWNHARLLLSTARPQISGNLPVLNPQELRIWSPPPPPMVTRSAASGIGDMRKKSAKRADYDEEAEGDSFTAGMVAEAMPAPAPAMEREEAVIDSSGSTGSSVVFQIGTWCDIPGDGEPHQVMIHLGDYPAEFIYQTVPRLAPYVYLKAQVRNETEFPFLPGKTRIFLGSNYVAEGGLNLVAPGENFLVDLGVDETITVQHQLVKKFDASAGLLAKRVKLEYRYRIDVENKKKSNETITLFDQIPLSRHQDIAIKVIEPLLKGAEWKGVVGELPTGLGPFVEESGRLIWNLAMAAGAKQSLTVAWQVEYPQGNQLTGL